MELHPNYRTNGNFVRFLTVGNKIYVPDTPDFAIPHQQVATQHNLHSEITRLKRESPNQVDGGIIEIDPQMQRISLAGNSNSFRLPVPGNEQVAEKHTVSVLREIFPGYTINPR